MNLTDFRDQLAARAAESDQPPADPLPALRGRIRTTKRRRTAVTAAGATLAVALAATVIPAALGQHGGPEQPPASATPTGPPDVVKDGIRFPGTIGGDTLVKAVIGDVGEEFSFELTVPAGETEIRPFCVLPEKADYLRSKYWVHVLVNGRMQVTSPCGADQAAIVGNQSWGYWAKPGHPGVNVKGMHPGQQVRISARVGYNQPGGPPAPNRQARIGVGIYRMGALRVVERAGEGLRIPEVAEHEGHTYRLADVVSGPTNNGAAITADIPADTPFLILSGGYGWTPDSKPSKTMPPYVPPRTGTRSITLTGLDEPIRRSMHYPTDERLIPGIVPRAFTARPAGTVTSTYTGPAESNFTSVLAVYRQER